MLATLLAGCRRPSVTDDPDTSSSGSVDTEQPLSPENSQLIDIGKYTIIRSESDITNELLSAIIQLRNDIERLTGGSIGWAADTASPADDAAYEILIGRTDRPQSAEVLATIDGNGYAIRQVGNKIVIVGSSDTITADAVEYFCQSYVQLSADSEGFRVPLVLDVVKTDYRFIELIQDGRCLYDVVYNDGLDATPDDKNKRDYQVQLSMNVREKIVALTGADAGISTDWVKLGTDTSSLCEILIGTTSRDESAAVRAEYAVNEYGFKVMGNKIVVTGWNEQSIGYAVNMFIQFLAESTVTAEDGTKTIRFLDGTARTKTVAGWTVDIPEYEGGTLEGCVTCNNDQLEYYYTGTTADEYRAYRQKLEREGYKLYCENEIAGNLYATYTTDTTLVHVYFVKYASAVRLITGSMSSDVGLPTNVDGAPKYTKITESKVTQMRLQYDVSNFGMCYIVTLEDGSFIVFDGGGHTEGTTTDYVRLFNLLDELNERPDGKIVIAAWIITHVHWDHHESFYKMCKTYGQKLTIEQCIVNAPDSIVYYNSYNPDPFMSNDFKTASAAVGGMTWIKPHTGMKFWVRNAEIEVLYTQEDLYPEPLHTFNNSSMVMRMTIGGQVITWLGDIQTEGSNIVAGMYGSYLKTDIAQVSHHGYSGATVKLYKLLHPSTLLWPTSQANFVKQTAGTGTQSYHAVDYYIAKNLKVTDIFVADEHNICLPLPYTAGSGSAVYIDVAAG